jgi:hypothetical protein
MLAMIKQAILCVLYHSIPVNGCSCWTIEGVAAAAVAVASVAVAAAAVAQRSSSIAVEYSAVVAVDVLLMHCHTSDHLLETTIYT